MQTIQIKNKFTGQISEMQVASENVFAALNHYRSLWSTEWAKVKA